jgi:hypothetical protein
MPFLSQREIEPDRPQRFVAPEKFFCDSRGRPLRKAKLLTKEMRSRGYEVRLTDCQDAVARMFGFLHLADLFATLGLGARSPGDEAIGQEAFEVRFWNQVKVLMEIGASPRDAETIIDAVRPTSGIPRQSRNEDGLAEIGCAAELTSDTGGAR